MIDAGDNVFGHVLLGRRETKIGWGARPTTVVFIL